MKKHQTIVLAGMLGLLSAGSLAFAQTSSTTDMNGTIDTSSSTNTLNTATDGGNSNANGNADRNATGTNAINGNNASNGTSSTVNGTNGSINSGGVMQVAPRAGMLNTMAYPAPMVVQIGGNGDALVRGTVQTVGANSITVLTWGGTWTVRTNANAAGTVSRVFAASNIGQGDMSAINAGDFVGAEGMVANNETSTINATLVRDWTTNPFQGSSMSETSALNTSAGVASSSAGVNMGATGASSTGGGTTY